LPSAFLEILGKVYSFAECLAVMALDKVSVFITWPSRYFFSREPLRHSAKTLQSARQGALSKQAFADTLVAMPALFVVDGTRQSLCQVLSGLCRVPVGVHSSTYVKVTNFQISESIRAPSLEIQA